MRAVLSLLLIFSLAEVASAGTEVSLWHSYTNQTSGQIPPATPITGKRTTPNPPDDRSALRFASRVENYVKYRPGYPAGVVTTFTKECGLTPKSVVADIGSGTGILSEVFLKIGNRVFGVEPNREMREAGARLLGNYAGFMSVDGAAEATGLTDCSVDFVMA